MVEQVQDVQPVDEEIGTSSLGEDQEDAAQVEEVKGSEGDEVDDPPLALPAGPGGCWWKRISGHTLREKACGQGDP